MMTMCLFNLIMKIMKKFWRLLAINNGFNQGRRRFNTGFIHFELQPLIVRDHVQISQQKRKMMLEDNEGGESL